MIRHYHSLIADDRRSDLAHTLRRLYRGLRREFDRSTARAMVNSVRLNATFDDTRRLTTDGLTYGPGMGRGGRCRAL